MLEGVGVDVAFAQRFVWQNVIVEGNQLNVQAIFSFATFCATSATCCSAPTITLTLMWFGSFLPARTQQCQRTNQGSNCRKGFKI
ncbi:hypothetical protein ACNKHQ_01175 [Shigella flexneri]